MLSRRSLSHTFQARLRDRQRVPKHQRQVDADDHRIGAERHQAATPWAAPAGSASTPQARSDWRSPVLAPSANSGDQRLDVGQAGVLKALQQRAQQRLMRRIVFQHQAGAVVIDARRLIPDCASQPTEEMSRPDERLRHNSRNIEPNAPRHRMTDRKFHSATIQNFSAGSIQPEVRSGQCKAAVVVFFVVLGLRACSPRSDGSGRTSQASPRPGVAALAPTSMIVKPAIPNASTILRSTVLWLPVLICCIDLLEEIHNRPGRYGNSRQETRLPAGSCWREHRSRWSAAADGVRRCDARGDRGIHRADRCRNAAPDFPSPG